MPADPVRWHTTEMRMRMSAAMTGDSSLRSVPPSLGAPRLPLDVFARFALDRHLPGPIFIELPSNDASTLLVYKGLDSHSSEEHLQLDAYTGQLGSRAAWKDTPVTARTVALGIDLREGSLFGRATQILSTVLASVFMFIATAGALAWYRRRPHGKLDLPKLVPHQALPLGLRTMLVVLGLCLPPLGLSLVLLNFATLLLEKFSALQPL